MVGDKDRTRIFKKGKRCEGKSRNSFLGFKNAWNINRQQKAKFATLRKNKNN
jgi:hypothetical protein